MISAGFATHRSGHQRRYADLFRQGMAKHGVEETTPAQADLVVLWGVHNRAAIEQCKRQGKDYLVMERGYLGNRQEWISLGFNGLNNRAEFVTGDTPRPDWPVKPWRDDGEHVLVIGQVPGDAACKAHGYAQWRRDIDRQAKCYGLPVKFREHPDIRRSKTTLEQDLAGAAVCVTFNSNSGVIACMEGVPTVTHDIGAMAWDVTSHRVGYHATPDRTDWLKWISQCQFHIDEIADGTAWAHLSQRFDSGRR